MEIYEDKLTGLELEYEKKKFFEKHSGNGEYKWSDKDIESHNSTMKSLEQLARNEKEVHMQNRTLEFNISGNIFYNGKEVNLDDITNAFLDACENNDWEFCGITMPLVEEITKIWKLRN